jgi:hypothetical protein
MPQTNEIPPELLDEMTPAVRAFVTQLLARLSSLGARLEVSERRVAELEKENRDLRQRAHGWRPQPTQAPGDRYSTNKACDN